jgi:hypothetical protein
MWMASWSSKRHVSSAIR